MEHPLAPLFTSVTHRVMIISAKGGVGKSTVTVNLAAGFKANGHKVGIFDADVHTPNIPALLGISRKGQSHDIEGAGSMIPIHAHTESVDMRPMKPYERYGLMMTSIGLLVGDEQAIQPDVQFVGDVVTHMLARVDWDGADMLLLDMPPTTGEPLRSIIEAGMIDAAVIVTTRERLAHLDNGRLLDLLKREGVRVLGVVENMTHMLCPHCNELIEMYPAPVESERAVYKHTPILANIPFHPELIRQNRGGVPLPIAEPTHPISAPFIDLATRIKSLMDKAII